MCGSSVLLLTREIHVPGDVVKCRCSVGDERWHIVISFINFLVVAGDEHWHIVVSFIKFLVVAGDEHWRTSGAEVLQHRRVRVALEAGAHVKVLVASRLLVASENSAASSGMQRHGEDGSGRER